MEVHLVVIDPQNSFCKSVSQDKQQVLHDGELCVPGAWDDMERVAAMVRRLGKKLNHIHVTLDSHHQHHIAHPCWYKNSQNGEGPSPFTVMRVENKEIIGELGGTVTNYRTAHIGHQKWTLEYLEKLEANKRYPHVIWPPHCLIGTPGHNIVAPLMEALLEWERTVIHPVNKVTKGSSQFVEHFSAVQAEVPYDKDPSTQLNVDFLTVLNKADIVLVAGEALSHCVANTFRDIIKQFGDAWAKKLVFLADASSSVPGFENLGTDFVNELVSKGMTKSSTVDFLAA